MFSGTLSRPSYENDPEIPLINTNEMAYKLKGDNNNEKSYYNN